MDAKLRVYSSESPREEKKQQQQKTAFKIKHAQTESDAVDTLLSRSALGRVYKLYGYRCEWEICKLQKWKI